MKRIKIADEIVIATYQETKSPSKTAARLGIGATTVERRLAAHGIARVGQRGKERKLPRTIVDEYEAGSSMNELARKYSVCLATVAEALHRAGFTARERGAKRKELSDELRNKVVQAYKEHGSQERVSKLLGIGQTVVSRYLRAAGVVVRPRRGRKIFSSEGYVLAWVAIDDPMACMAQSSGYVLEHRLVMARSLGRSLERNESVHHINGNRADNRIDNLQLRQGHHGTGVVHRCRDCGSYNVETEKLKVAH